MPFTKLDLTNMVMNELGRLGVANINNDDNATLIDQRITTFLPELLKRANWVWTIRQRIDDTPLTSTPNTNFLYAYQLPFDYGRMLDVVNNYPYAVIDGTLCTNQKPVQYFYNVNDSVFANNDYSIFPPEFRDYCALFVASRVAKPLTQDLSLVQQLFMMQKEKLNECVKLNRMEERIVTAPYNAYNRRVLFS